MTQLSATSAVSKLSLHRETVMHLAGGQASGVDPAYATGAMCPSKVQQSCMCTLTCTCITCKHCTKKAGGCLA